MTTWFSTTEEMKRWIASGLEIGHITKEDLEKSMAWVQMSHPEKDFYEYMNEFDQDYLLVSNVIDYLVGEYDEHQCPNYDFSNGNAAPKKSEEVILFESLASVDTSKDVYVIPKFESQFNILTDYISYETTNEKGALCSVNGNEFFIEFHRFTNQL